MKEAAAKAAEEKAQAEAEAAKIAAEIAEAKAKAKELKKVKPPPPPPPEVKGHEPPKVTRYYLYLFTHFRFHRYLVRFSLSRSDSPH